MHFASCLGQKTLNCGLKKRKISMFYIKTGTERTFYAGLRKHSFEAKARCKRGSCTPPSPSLQAAKTLRFIHTEKLKSCAETAVQLSHLQAWRESFHSLFEEKNDRRLT